MMLNVYEKGKIYVTDGEDGETDFTYIPRNCFLGCDDDEVLEYFGNSEEVLREALPYGCTETECAYMLKTVTVNKKIEVKVENENDS